MAETRLGAWKAIGVLALLVVVVVVPLAPTNALAPPGADAVREVTRNLFTVLASME